MSILGSEPTYTPRQSYASQLGMLLGCLVVASTPEAVPTTMARAIAVLVNMVVSPGCVATPTVLARLARLARHRHVGDLERHGRLAAAAVEVELDGLADADLLELAGKIREPAHSLAVHADDDVAELLARRVDAAQPRARGRRARD